MPQLFQVLKCFKCLFFQVHQTKKSNKWDCKLCGEKQSIKRHYGVGIAKDCRLQVQKLNGIRGEADNIIEISQLNESSDENDPEEHATIVSNQNKPLTSKWSEFVETTDVVEPPEKETMYLGNAEVVLEAPKKKRKFSHPIAIKKINKSIATPCSSKTDDTGKSFMVCDSLTTLEFDLNKCEDLNKPDTDKVNLCSLPLNIRKDNICTQKGSFNESSKNGDYFINSQPEPIKPIKEHFLIQKVSKHSKWAQFAEESDEENDTLADEPPMKKATDKKYPLCNKEDGDTDDPKNNYEITLEFSQENKPDRNKLLPHNLFSLCDEKDLDEVLDI